MPQLEAVAFGTGPDELWPRLVRVLTYTAMQHCLGWSVRVLHDGGGLSVQSVHATPAERANSQKLEAWVDRVRTAPDGAELLLVDADIVVCRPLDALWTLDFDLAYTARSGKYPFNGGVIAVRVSSRTRWFMERWRAENERMLHAPLHHISWRVKYGGINQAALGCLLESGAWRDLSIRPVPCLEWNCEDSSWADFDPQVTRLVHVKSALRRAVFTDVTPAAGLEPLVTLWRALEREALASACL